MKTHQTMSFLLRGLDVIKMFCNTPDLPVQHITAFLLVAQRGEMPMADLEKGMGLAQSSISRAVAKLGKGYSPREPGFGLIEAEEDPYERRRKIIRLTPRGRELVKEIEVATGKILARAMKDGAA